ncbi:MAG: hypothetical protein L0Z50_34330 [Verrucomicrobiales bacterium]|nr:hypothetical protein [Verrucomicrobiales bacterium]
MNPKNILIVLTLGALCAAIGALTHSRAAETSPSSSTLRRGTNFITTRLYSAEEDQQILKAFEGLRVADVSDGMDAAALHNTGLVDSDIRPLWRDTEKFTHRFIGIAVTARYVPTQRPTAGTRTGRSTTVGPARGIGLCRRSRSCPCFGPAAHWSSKMPPKPMSAPSAPIIS